MKSSEFRDLFAEYAREISDPKNREVNVLLFEAFLAGGMIVGLGEFFP